MISTSTTEPDRYTPAWRAGTDAPVYLIRAGSVRERAALEAELSGSHRAGRIYGFELTQAVRDGIALFLADDPAQERVLAVLDQEGDVDDRAAKALVDGQADEALAIRAEISARDRQLLADVRGVLAEHYGPYRDLLAQRARRLEMAPIEALRRFLVGFENVNAPFTRDRDGMVSEATLAAIDPLELSAAGNHAYGMLYGGGQKRPLAQPSPSADTPKTSRRARSKVAGA